MRKIIGLSLTISFLYSCSILTKVPVLKPQKNFGWTKAEEYYAYSFGGISLNAYEFQNDSFAIAVFTCPKSGTNVLVGPPFIPILPNFFSVFNYNVINEPFFADIKLVNRRTSVENFDLEKLNFRQKNKELIPAKIIQIKARDRGRIRGMVNERLEAIEEFSREQNIITINPSDSVFVRYEFAKPTNEVRQLTVNLERQNFSIPSLELKTKNKIIYTTAYHD